MCILNQPICKNLYTGVCVLVDNQKNEKFQNLIVEVKK